MSVEELAIDVKQFLSKEFSNGYSEFWDLKVYCSAYLHHIKRHAIFFGPMSLISNEVKEIKDLYGLVFCDLESNDLLAREKNIFGCMSNSQKRDLTKKDSALEFIEESEFVILKKGRSESPLIEQKISMLEKMFGKTHFFLTWGEYSVWWRVSRSKQNDRSISDGIRFGNPDTLNRDLVEFVNWNKSSYYPFQMISAFPSARFFKNSGEIEEVENTTGRTKLKIRDRLLVSYDKFLLCGASGIALTTNTVAILDINNNPYNEYLGSLYSKAILKNPNRTIRNLDGIWMAVHNQNGIISHFIFEVLKRILYVARLKKFKLLLTGEKLPKFLMDFFLVDSVLKDNILEIQVADPNTIYKADKTLVCFENEREMRPEDCLNFQWYGESVLQRNIVEKTFNEKVYISRRDSPESRSILNEYKLIELLGKRGYEIIQLNELSLPEKLSLFKKARKIITPAGSGALFRHMVSTDGSLRILLSAKCVWTDYVLCILGGGPRKESLDIFEPEQSLGSNQSNFLRNHASWWLPNSFFEQDF